MTVNTTWVSPLSGTMDLSNGAIVNETNLDAFASDILNLGGLTGHIGARAYNSADISIPTGADTAVTLNSESYDTDPNGEIHSTASNTSRMTIQTAGKYAIKGGGLFAVNGTGQRLLKLRVNGATYIALSPTLKGDASLSVGQQVHGVYDFAAGDYVEMMAYQDSGGALNLSAFGVYTIWLAVAKV